MLGMLCVGWRLGVDFVVMVGRLEGKEVGAFGALNLPSLKSPDLIRPDPIEQRSGGDLFYVHRHGLSILRHTADPA